MSHLFNFALGGVTGTPAGSPLTSLLGVGGVEALGVGSQNSAAAAASPLAAFGSTASRDAQMPDLSALSSSVNLLGSAASLQSNASSASDELLDLPPMAPMPAPAKPADVPTDDHGQSNIVFSDADGDGSLIH